MRPVRIWYEKRGRLKYVSHLDMNRCWQRLVRRAGLPVWITEGFKPHPYLNFALPLSLGCESLCEAVDVRLLDEEMPLERAAELLRAAAPPDLPILRVSEPVLSFTEIAFAEFSFRLETRDADGDAAALEAFLRQKEILCEKKGKKGVRTVDIRPQIVRAELVREEPPALYMTLAAGGEHNLNPALALGALRAHSGRPFETAQAVRRALYDREMRPFA